MGPIVLANFGMTCQVMAAVHASQNLSDQGTPVNPHGRAGIQAKNKMKAQKKPPSRAE